MILIIEGLVMCFVLLIVCVVGISNGSLIHSTTGHGVRRQWRSGLLGWFLADVNYIPKKVLIRKWFGTIVMNPLIAAIAAGVMELF